MELPDGYKLYLVSADLHATAYVYVAATSAESANEAAAEHAHVGLCHQCSDEIELGEIEFGLGRTEEAGQLPRWTDLQNAEEIEELLYK